MWGFIQTTIISIFLILIVQYLFYYIRDTFTTKKTKDLVEIQTKKYKSIVEELLEYKKKSTAPYFFETSTVNGDKMSEAESAIDYDTMAENLQQFVTNKIES
jgi:uncharacterized membrane protein YhiD involved in acid resistance